MICINKRALQEGAIATLLYIGVAWLTQYIFSYIHPHIQIASQLIILVLEGILIMAIMGFLLVRIKQLDYNLNDTLSLGAVYFIVPFLFKYFLSKYGLWVVDLVKYALVINIVSLPAMFTFLLGLLPGLVTTTVITAIQIVICIIVIIEIYLIGVLVNNLYRIAFKGGGGE